jgi:hypothetical protein
MSEPQVSERNPADGGQADLMSALFAQMVMQQSNLALMLLGKTAHPESGQIVRDIEGAKFFIDQLEMLEVKTRGNLSKEEAALLKQSLMALRMAFVESVNAPPPPAEAGKEGGAAAAGAASATEPAQTAAPPPASVGDEESRKKFTKKY